jgi:hypothetical protein
MNENVNRRKQWRKTKTFRFSLEIRISHLKCCEIQLLEATCWVIFDSIESCCEGLLELFMNHRVRLSIIINSVLRWRNLLRLIVKSQEHSNVCIQWLTSDDVYAPGFERRWNAVESYDTSEMASMLIFHHHRWHFGFANNIWAWSLTLRSRKVLENSTNFVISASKVLAISRRLCERVGRAAAQELLFTSRHDVLNENRSGGDWEKKKTENVIR